MKIIADQNIPLLTELFADIGHIDTVPGRTMDSTVVNAADILLVRSITSVNARLLEGSAVKFVGSCTIGIDHLDTDYLQQQSIQWANAPGCNAHAVVQYVFSAMAAVEPEWLNKTVGIIGCGNIGHRLYQRLQQLGVSCRVYDPFLSAEQCTHLTSLESTLQSDIITCHTPLTATGDYPTYHLLDETLLSSLREGTLLINSGRGAVIDNQALLKILSQKKLKVVLDVWENEPNINRELLQKVSLGTPHIAGYSIEGKEQGSWMIYKALCEFLNQPVSENKRRCLTRDTRTIPPSSTKLSFKQRLNQLLLLCYDIRRDDALLRGESPFDQLRKQYLSRREYTHFLLPPNEDTQLFRAFDIIRGGSF